MTKRVLRVGGVEEPFNLPFIRAFERDAFAPLGVEVIFETFDGGTGAMVTALENHSIDLATLLTEGAVTAICRGSGVRVHSGFTDTPLKWGIHVSGQATQTDVSELRGKKFAISRFGSGSELMAWELADQQGWKLKEKQLVVVGGIKGAIEALPKRKAHIFLWERFVTAPLVKQGVFKRLGDMDTAWPAFQLAARPGLLSADDDRVLIDSIVSVVQAEARRLKDDTEGTIDEIVARYGMAKRDARTWLKGVGWSQAARPDTAVLETVMTRMEALGRIEAPLPVEHLLR